MIDVARRMRELSEENERLKNALEKSQSELAESVRSEIEYVHELRKLREQLQARQQQESVDLAGGQQALSQHDHGV